MRWLAIVLALSTLQVETIAVPAWSNPYVEYDSVRAVFVDHTPEMEAWRYTVGSVDKTGRLLSTPIQVPSRAKIVVKFHNPWDTRRYGCENLGGFMFAGMITEKRGKFVLFNVEETENQDVQYRVWPHLGILSVGTAAAEAGWEVQLWDELVQNHCTLDELVKPGDVVGLSLVDTGIRRGVELANQAKALGAQAVIAGNDAAIFRSRQLLTQCPAIDAVFTGNSLETVRDYFELIEHDPSWANQLPGVCTSVFGDDYGLHQTELRAETGRRRASWRQNPSQRQDVFNVPRFELYSSEYWQTVWRNYREAFGHKHHSGATVRNGIINLAQGCTRAATGDICRYCTIYGVNDVRIPDIDHLERLVAAYDAFGFNYLYNTTDSAYEMAGLCQRLQTVGARWGGLTLYGRAWGLAHRPELLDEWQTLVSDRLLINCGLDSGDEDVLKRGVVKNTRSGESFVELNRQAVKMIEQSGAHLHCSFIFGSPGETQASCERTCDFIEWMIGELGDQLDICETDIWWLNFGSPCSRVFTNYGYAQELAALAGNEISREAWQREFASYRKELSVPAAAEQAWYHYFTGITLAEAQAYNERVAVRMAAHTGTIRGRAFKPPLT